jgi:hypothetical protein
MENVNEDEDEDEDKDKDGDGDDNDEEDDDSDDSVDDPDYKVAANGKIDELIAFGGNLSYDQ